MSKSKILFWIKMAVAALIIICLFLPYVTQTEKQMEGMSDMKISDDITINASAAKDLSIAEYIQVYMVASKNLSALGVDDTYIAVYLGLYLALAMFTVLNLIMALLGKNIPEIVFSGIIILLNYAIKWDFDDRNIIGEYEGTVGIAYNLFYAFAFCMIGVSVVSVIVNKVSDGKKL